ncbi:hypothetical protein D3C77_260230 [compost metagenome]
MLLGQPKETNPTLGACFVLDIAQSLLGGSYSRARILPEWLTKNYTTEVVRPNNIYGQLLSLVVREAVPAHEGGHRRPLAAGEAWPWLTRVEGTSTQDFFELA